ncbi:cyclase family protein [Nocardioides sp.]|jgi:kynurenine formamidase|uniref:cyclase family protein n=1 Tax=Nocardioides sp. TaxID=35761 RepID=UPI002A02D1A8|nr:cyclase family protein [Nocardioides sp.]MCW2795713.1 cyclase family protein [Nocardioides sp.]
MADNANNWGRWGEEDERGSLNLLDESTTLAAVSIPKTGKLYQLGLPIQRTGIPLVDYRGAPQRLSMVSHADEHMYEPYGGTPGVGCHEDVLVLASHTSTHMDALCHVYEGGKTYNGFGNDNMETFAGATRCGIDKAGPIVTRGVLIDVAKAKGVDWLAAGYVITVEDLEQALTTQGSELRAGDAALVRTGWVDWFYASGEVMSLEQPGIGLDAAAYLARKDVVAVCSDNTAVEAQPFDRGEFLGSHVELLVRHGIYLIEHLNLSVLSADDCYEFLFCTSPLRVTGATASPVNPFAVG